MVNKRDVDAPAPEAFVPDLQSVVSSEDLKIPAAKRALGKRNGGKAC